MDFGNTVWEYNFPGITATKSDCPVFQVLWGWRQQIEYWALYEPFQGFTDDSAGKEFTCNAGDTGDDGSIPGLGRSPGGGNGNPFQYSYLENPMDGGAWWATVHGVAKSQTLLSN